MSKSSVGNLIRLKGVQQNNLKNFDLDLPSGQLIVVTGLSGSGKSSLAFDTLYAEGQRRYIETFSPYARQFLDRMDKPRVDSIQGIPPAIAIEQRNSVKSTRSTVGTMTEICDYMKVLWSHISQLYCRKCGQPVRKDSPHGIWEELQRCTTGSGKAACDPEVLIAFELRLSTNLSIEETLALISKQGYQRLLFRTSTDHGPDPIEVIRLDEAHQRLGSGVVPESLRVVQDRIRLSGDSRARFTEACEQAYHFGKGKLEIYILPSPSACRRFSNRFHCAECDIDYAAPTPALFSFNHPVGACPACRGFGRTITIDYNLAVPNPSLTLAQGAVKPWQTGQSAECQGDLTRFCRIRHVPMDVPFEKLSPEMQRWVIDGDVDYGTDAKHEWPHAWYGIKGYFRSLETRSYKMHVRVLLSRYRSYQTCPECAGRRFQPDALLFKRSTGQGHLMTLADFYSMPVETSLAFIQSLAEQHASLKASDPLRLVLGEVHARLGYLHHVGLGYLTLDRATRSLSGGETERVNLTTCLGSRLVNTLFVLDEPTVGLHARDTERLVGILQRLRDAGNTVVVVEHDPAVMRAADQLIDLGPGHGEAGGSLVFQGSFKEILRSTNSLTGQYLSGKQSIDPPTRRPVAEQHNGAGAPIAWLCPTLKVSHANLHNLKDLEVEIPLQRFVCVTGVSGSGKSTLIREVLFPALHAKVEITDMHLGATDEDSEKPQPQPDLKDPALHSAISAKIEGWEQVGRVVMMDQSALGKTPRSNPAVYVGAFEYIRQLFAKSEPARQHSLNASAFSFNSAQGQCEMCAGAGFEKIEMQFLSDVFVRCPACRGRRYRQHILDIKIAPGNGGHRSTTTSPLNSAVYKGPPSKRHREWSIADLLEATIDENIEFLNAFGDVRPAVRAVELLRLLQDVGLGYLKLGQPINTLSGGESQRLKLATHLAELAPARGHHLKPALFLFDEPTTGLHFADVRVLLDVFQRLVEQGHSVIVVEHNVDLIKSADWILDLGPEAGDGGGQLVAQGTPEQVADCEESHTGRSLRQSGIKGASKAPTRRN